MATLIESLQAGKVEVTFVKKDGSVRVMVATTNPSLISYMPTQGAPSRERMGLVTVWDMDLGQWRSFREDQVTTWKVI